MAKFNDTHWSVVLAAQRGADAALAALCATYYYPLYAFIRRHGHAADAAQDLLQEYFARFLEKDYLATVDRDRGRFRSFLLASLKHFLANQWDQRSALKRGGGVADLSLDLLAAEDRYAREPVAASNPEAEYERRWALLLLERVLGRLREEHAHAPARFDRLKGFLVGGEKRYREVADELGTTPEALRVGVHRLRRRFRALLRDEIAHTVADSSAIDDEIAHLFTILGR